MVYRYVTILVTLVLVSITVIWKITDLIDNITCGLFVAKWVGYCEISLKVGLLQLMIKLLFLIKKEWSTSMAGLS